MLFFVYEIILCHKTLFTDVLVLSIMYKCVDGKSKATIDWSAVVSDLNQHHERRFPIAVGEEIKWPSAEDLGITNYLPFEKCPSRADCVHCSVIGCGLRAGSDSKSDTDSGIKEMDESTNSSTNSSAKTVDVDWSGIFTAVFGISLYGCNRYVSFQDELHKTGLCKWTIIYRPLSAPVEYPFKDCIRSVGAMGCWTSHQYVNYLGANHLLNHVHSPDSDRNQEQERKRHRILIVEDDILMNVKSEIELELAIHETRHNLNEVDRMCESNDGKPRKPWHAYYLGHLPLFRWPRKSHLRLWETKSFETHAYILSFDGMIEIGHGFKWHVFHEQGKSRGAKLNTFDEAICRHLLTFSSDKHLLVQRHMTTQSMKRGNDKHADGDVEHHSFIGYSDVSTRLFNFTNRHPRIGSALWPCIFTLPLLLIPLFIVKYVASFLSIH